MFIKLLIGIVITITLSYGTIEAIPLIKGPQLSVTSPEPYSVSEDGIVAIKGKATRVASLLVNGSLLLPTAGGTFATTLAFPHGTSILTFVVEDRFGRIRSERRDIFVP